MADLYFKTGQFSSNHPDILQVEGWDMTKWNEFKDGTDSNKESFRKIDEFHRAQQLYTRLSPLFSLREKATMQCVSVLGSIVQSMTQCLGKEEPNYFQQHFALQVRNAIKKLQPASSYTESVGTKPQERG